MVNYNLEEFSDNLDNEALEFVYKKLKKIIEYLSVDYDGEVEVKFTLEKKKVDKDSLRYRWKKYLLKYKDVKPDDFMSDWSPNNGTFPVIQSNKILNSVVDFYYNDYYKYELVDMLDLLDDYFSENFDFTPEDYINGRVTPNQEIDEVLEFYMGRNPRFIFDW